jgi:hypothetical protein
MHSVCKGLSDGVEGKGCFILCRSWSLGFTLKMDAILSSEMFVTTYNPEEYDWRYHRHENLKSLKMTVFWYVALCSLVEIDRRFRGTYCLHHQGPDDGTPLKRRSRPLTRHPSFKLCLNHKVILCTQWLVDGLTRGPIDTGLGGDKPGTCPPWIFDKNQNWKIEKDEELCQMLTLKRNLFWRTTILSWIQKRLTTSQQNPP